jgi:hypothetical protein
VRRKYRRTPPLAMAHPRLVTAAGFRLARAL